MNMKDVAELAGVSVATVSKVINKKDIDISAATRKRVLEIVQEYQYVPYFKARKATLGQSRIIGVLLIDENEEFLQILNSIEKALSSKGYSIIVAGVESSGEVEEKEIKILKGKNADGLILIGNSERRNNLQNQIQLEKLPCVVVATHQISENTFSTVLYDEKVAASKAVEYLVQMGHHKIGCIVKGDSPMHEGYIQTLKKHGIPYDEMNVFTENVCEEKGQIALKLWLSMSHTAIFCEEIESVVCLNQIFQERGIVIPDDISVICGKDSRYLQLLGVPVTAIESANRKMGTAAAELIVEAIEVEEEYHMVRNAIPVNIIERDSVSRPQRGRRGEKLVVVGSMNMDITVSVPHIPTEGETVIASSMALIPGGKGANQAVGVGKLGGKVSLIGCLGNDSDGKEIYNSLVNNKVNTEGVLFDKTLSTGKAYINISGDNNKGESTIVIYQGSNRNLSREHIKKCAYMIEGARYCLLSLEIPIDAAYYTISLCKRYGTDIIIKPSGFNEISREILDGVTYFVPNKKELHCLVPGIATIEEKAEYLWKSGVENVIVTLGKDGCYLRNNEYQRFFKAAEFSPIDTTGGADAFISALAVYLSEGVQLVHAIGFATYCAGICVTRHGVQPAMPERAVVDIYQDEIFSQFPLKE